MVIRSKFDLPLVEGLSNQCGVSHLTYEASPLMVMRSKYELHLIKGLVMQSGDESS